MATLLFIDDDPDLLNINKKYFTKKDYSVHTISDLSTLNSTLANADIDCILLDIMMPQLDGYQILQSVRKKYDTPVIFLSGKVLPDDKIKGLLMGADDYMTKPYDFGELEARIQVQIRKNKVVSPLSFIEISGLIIDTESRTVTYEDCPIYLSNREFELLVQLVRHPNEILTYESIAKTMWGSFSLSDKNSIMVTASRLRKKMSQHSKLDNLIESIRSKGYRITSK